MTPEQVQEALKPRLPNVSITVKIEDGRYGLVVRSDTKQKASTVDIFAEYQRVTAVLDGAGLQSDGTLVEHLVAPTS
jgi:hypothetical protein